MVYIANYSSILQEPQIQQTSSQLEFLEAHDTKEARFECVSRSKAPLEEYRWFFKNQAVIPKVPGSNPQNQLSLNLTRKDFNDSLKCVITQKINAHEHIGQAVTQKDLIFNMNPVVLDVLRIREANFEIEIESWPSPNFVRISTVEECDNKCVIYKMVNGR